MARVLVACEFSGVVRRAFSALGHEVWSCDLLPAEDGSPYHFREDVRSIIEKSVLYGWPPFDLMVAHPPCTYLSRAGARWWRDPERMALADEAEAFVLELWNAPIERIAIENPIGQLNKRWRYPDQIVQPYHFGEPYSKATCLWLKNVPPLFSTVTVERFEPWVASNTSHRARNGLPPKGKVHNARDASRTFPGIASAMAEQWGALLDAESLAA